MELYSKNKKNIELLESMIKDVSQSNSINGNELKYNVIGIIIKDGVQEAYNYLNRYTKNEDFYNCRDFADIIKIKQEEDDFMLNPMLVEEGVNVCYKCGSKKTVSYSKQTRSADEGTTVFCMCVNCGNKWKM